MNRQKSLMQRAGLSLVLISLLGLLLVGGFHLYTEYQLKQQELPPAPVAPDLTMIAPFENAYHNRRLVHLVELYEHQTGKSVALDFLSSENYLQQITLRYSQGTVPDLLFLNTYYVPYLIQEGYLLDCTQTYQQISDQLATPFLLDSVPFATWEEKRYAFPITATTYALLVNDDLLQKQGLTVPKTWAQLADTSLSLSSVGQAGFAFPALQTEEVAEYYLAALLPNASLYELDGTENKELLYQIGFLAAHGQAAPLSLTYNKSDLSQLFRQQEVGMMLCTTEQLTEILNTPPSFRWSIAPVPLLAEDSVPRDSMVSSKSLALTKQANVSEAEGFLQFLYSDSMLREFHLQYGSLPIQQGRLAEYQEDSRWHGAGFPLPPEEQSPFKPYRLWVDITHQMGKDFQNLLLEQQTAEGTAAVMQENVRTYRVSS